MTRESIGQRIQRLRIEKNLTQGDLSDYLDVSPQAVSKWENDIAYPDITILPKLGKILGVSVDYILGEEEREVRYEPEKVKKNIDDLILKIRVTEGKEKVKVNIPFKLLILLLDSNKDGMDNINIAGKNIDASNIDFEKIIKMVENGVLGKLVEVEGEDGENVSIFVE